MVSRSGYCVSQRAEMRSHPWWAGSGNRRSIRMETGFTASKWRHLRAGPHLMYTFPLIQIDRYQVNILYAYIHIQLLIIIYHKYIFYTYYIWGICNSHIYRIYMNIINFINQIEQIKISKKKKKTHTGKFVTKINSNCVESPVCILNYPWNTQLKALCFSVVLCA